LVAAEGVILGFQHYLVVLGTIVIVSTILVPLIGGGNVVQIFNTLLFSHLILFESDFFSLK